MRANAFGELCGGNGAGHSFYQGIGTSARSLGPDIDGADWWTDDWILSRRHGRLVRFARATDFLTWDDIGVEAGNVWAAGGGNFATTRMGPGVYQTWGRFNGSDLPAQFQTAWAIADASRDGALLFRLNDDWTVLWPSGAIEYVGQGFEARLDWSGGQVIFLNAVGLYVKGIADSPQIVPMMRGMGGQNKPAVFDQWVSYAFDE